MSQHDESPTLDRDSRLLRAAGTIGDLGHPFYAEERQRDVWNEASAVGLQLVLLLGLAAAAAMVWLGGAPGLPYAVAMLSVLGAGSGASLLYARKLGVEVNDPGGVLRLRLVPYAVLLVVGVGRTAPPEGFSSGLAIGIVVGSGAALFALTGSGLRARHRRRRDTVEPS